MKKKIFLTLGSTLLSAMIALSAGCSLTPETVGITSIQKTATNGLVDTYTIYYSNGTTSTFEITNGKDGEDGQKGEKGDNATGEPVSVTSIQKTATNGLVDTYTVYYSDGTTSNFEVTNGKDGEDGKDGANGTNGEDGEKGEDGKDLTALDLYETYKSVYGEDLSYAEFLALYMSFDESVGVDGSKVINKCLRSVGKVYAEFTEYDTSTLSSYDTKQAFYTGACIVYRVDEDYTYFATNYHVVYDEKAISDNRAETAHCYLYGSEGRPTEGTDGSGNKYTDYGDYAIECTYIGGAATYDIAILRAKTADVKAINDGVQAVTLADSYHVGETAVAIGNPNGAGISATEGIVSVDNEFISLSVDGTSRSYRSMRIDTALYQGNSGGGVFNAHGELIGIANAGKLTDQNINYAIPVGIVKAVTENILLHHKDGDDTTQGVYKTTLGVTVQAQNSKYVYDEETGYGNIVEDIVVLEVASDSIALSLGLQISDVITKIEYGGKVHGLNRYFDIADHLLHLTSGVSFRFIYERGGVEKQTTYYTIKASDLSVVA